MSIDREMKQLCDAVRNELQEIIAQYVETGGGGLWEISEADKLLAAIIRNKVWIKEGL